MKSAREYSMYGINKKRFSQILQYMLSMDRQDLFQIAQKADSFTALYLVESIIDGISFDRQQDDIPASKSNFYRYRRLLFHLVDLRMKEEGL